MTGSRSARPGVIRTPLAAGTQERAARPIKRSFRIAGHQTSISLEGTFWDALKEAAEARRLPVARLVAEIDATRGETNLSSAVRVWLFETLKASKTAG